MYNVLMKGMQKVVDLIRTQDEEGRPQARWVRAEKKRPARKKKTKERKPRSESESALLQGKVKKIKERKVKPEKVKRPKERKPINFSFKIILIIAAAVVVIIAAGFVWLTLNPKLFLTLQIKQSPLELHEEIELNASQAALDIAKMIVPAQLLEQTQEKSIVSKAKGLAYEDKKAAGVIKVYNNTNPPISLTLRADTRFLSSGVAKVFRAVDKVVLSAPARQGGKIIPSAVDVPVVAQEVGDEYNIGPSKFSVPGLKGTSSFYAIWGESQQSMAGGSKKEVPAISETDRENAKSNLYKALKDSAMAAIKEKIPAGYTLDERFVSEDDFSFTCAESTSTVATETRDLEFTCSGKLSLKALIFKLDDLKTLILSLFNERKPDGREIRQESLQFSLVPKSAVTQSGRLAISLGSGVKTYKALDQNAFLNRILGKDKEQIEQIAASDFPTIESVNFKFWPFWLKKASSTTERVKLHLTF